MKKIAKYICSSIKKIVKLLSNNAIFLLGPADWPIAMIFPDGSNYNVAEFYPNTQLYSVVSNKIVDFITVLKMSQYNADYALHNKEHVAKEAIESIKRRVKNKVFYSSIDLAMLLVKNKYRMNKSQLFDFLVMKNKMLETTFNEEFGKIDTSITTESTTVINHKKWIIYYDKKLKRSSDDLLQILDGIQSHFDQHGLGFLCYGKIFVVDNLGGGILADYEHTSDSIRVGFKQLKKTSIVSAEASIAHELGHRLYKKTFSQDKKLMILSKYYEMKHKIPEFKPGDEITEVKTGNLFKVMNKSYTKQYNLYYVVLLEKLGLKSSKADVLNAKYRVPSQALGIQFVGKSTEDNERNSFIPRSYSLENEEEFFSVLCEKFVFDKLSEPAKSWMISLIKN